VPRDAAGRVAANESCHHRKNARTPASVYHSAQSIVVGDDVEEERCLKNPGHKGSGSVLQTVIAAIIIALAVGGSAPWWWNKVFQNRPSEPPITSSAEPSKTPYMGPLEGGTDRLGGDLSKVGIQVNTAAECSDMCLHEQNCLSMTFVKHPDANGGICWLKPSIPPPQANQAMVSAVKYFR